MDRHHPYWKKDPEFKYTYCFGLGVMSMGHMKSIMETQDFFEELMRSIWRKSRNSRYSLT